MTVPPGKTTFTLAEAAELLSCHKETLRRAIRKGALRAARLGRGFRISRYDLEAYWTASGGGELFGTVPGRPAPEAGTKHKRSAPEKKERQWQLSLPGTEPED